MHPFLGQILGTTIRSYGVLTTIGIALGLFLVMRSTFKQTVDKRALVDVVLVTLIAGLVGAKLLSILIAIPEYVEQPWTWVELFGSERRFPRFLVVWEGGLVYYGAVVCGGLAAWIVARRRELSFGNLADAVTPALALGHAWGRMGCFLAGCCFGKATDSPLGVSFGAASIVYEAHSDADLLIPPFDTTYPVHPVQMYEAGAELMLVALLLWVANRRKFSGQVALTYLSCYAAIRFVLEIYRGDSVRGFLGDPVALVSLNRWLGVDGGSPTFLSTSQFGSLLILLACAGIGVLLVSQGRRDRGHHHGTGG